MTSSEMRLKVKNGDVHLAQRPEFGMGYLGNRLAH